MKTNILMDDEKTCIAWFKKKKVMLTTGVEPEGSGTITPVTGQYDKGTIVEVEALPNPNYEFDHWEGIGKWSGLGMMTCDTNNTSEFDSYVDTLLANGFTQIRMNIRPYEDVNGVAQNKAAVIRAVAKGADIIWGIGGYPETPITAENWVDFRVAILSAAQWAQDNGVYEFQLGNEEESHVDNDTMTIAQLITNLKSVATEVKAIFTNGNVSYSCFGANIDDWITAGKGDIDILASNIYMGGEGNYGDGWKTLITNLVNAFGADGTYLTEFAPSWSAIDDYSADETVQAAAETEMIEYIKASGMTRAIAFLYRGHTPVDALTNAFGILKSDGTYRQLWNSLLNSK